MVLNGPQILFSIVIPTFEFAYHSHSSEIEEVMLKELTYSMSPAEKVAEDACQPTLTMDPVQSHSCFCKCSVTGTR